MRGRGQHGNALAPLIDLRFTEPVLAAPEAMRYLEPMPDPTRVRHGPIAVHPGELLPMAVDTNTNVLVAEDNPNLRKVIVNIVRKIGYKNVVEADDGIKAWTEIERGTIGLVLTDWSMPGMNGLELLKKVRGAKDPIKNLPILMITAADTKDSILTAGKEGVDAYIIKPFSVKTI